MENNHDFGSVLAYFACGPIHHIGGLGYHPFDTVVLVDRNLGLQHLDEHPDRNEFLSGRFILLEADAMVAVDILHWMGIRLDAYLAWNEGLWQGGGDYHLNGRYFLKYLSQILGKQYWHVHNEHYFRMRLRKDGLPTIPFIRSSEFASRNGDLSRIARMFHNRGHHNAGNSMIRLMHRDMTLPTHPEPDVTFTRGNIWDVKGLDMLFIPRTCLPSEYVIMRKPDPAGNGYLSPRSTIHARLPRQSSIYPELWRTPVMEQALESRYMKRFALDAEGITNRVIRAISEAPEGSRKGFMGGVGGDWEGAWEAAQRRGGSIHQFEM
jgi:hypothetical protein